MEKRLIDYKDLSTKEKADHIWEYYKLQIIGAILAVLFVFWLLNHYIINPPAETVLDISIFGEYSDTDAEMELKEKLDGLVIDEGANEETNVEFFITSTEVDYNIQQATVVKMAGKSSLGEFDIMIFADGQYQRFLDEDALMPLTDLIQAGDIQVNEERYIYGTKATEHPDQVYLVDISDKAFIKKIMPTEEKAFLAIHVNTKHLDKIRQTLPYLMEE